MASSSTYNLNENEHNMDHTILSLDANDDESFIDDEQLQDIANPSKLRPVLTQQQPLQPNPAATSSVAQQQQQQQRPVPVQHPVQPMQQKVQQQKQQQGRTTFQQGNIEEDMDEEEDIDEEEDEEGDEGSVLSQLTGQSNESEKLDLLMKLDDLRSNGYVVRQFDLHTHSVELKKELHRLQRNIELKSSIKFQQKMLMATVSAIEYGNKTFDPFKVDLDGWSENIFENIEDFNHVFERLYDKYRRRGEMSPEIELLLTLTGSAFMFNMTRQLFKNIPQPFHNLQQTVRNAYNESRQQQQQQMPVRQHPQAQQQQQQQQQQHMPVRQQQQPARPPTSFDAFASVLGSLSTPSVPPRIVPEMISHNPVRQTQLDSFQNIPDGDDMDRFSVASSTESIVEPSEHEQPLGVLKPKKGPKGPKRPKGPRAPKQQNGRELVL